MGARRGGGLGGGRSGGTMACSGGGGGGGGGWSSSPIFLEQPLEREFTPFFLQMTARVCGGGDKRKTAVVECTILRIKQNL